MHLRAVRKRREISHILLFSGGPESLHMSKRIIHWSKNGTLVTFHMTSITSRKLPIISAEWRVLAKVRVAVGRETRVR